MKKRGKILRDPRMGPGLLMIEGRQYRFCLDGAWTSEVHPTPGLAVEVKLDRRGQILAVTAASESQLTRPGARRSVDTAMTAGVRILRKVVAKVWHA